MSFRGTGGRRSGNLLGGPSIRTPLILFAWSCQSSGTYHRNDEPLLRYLVISQIYKHFNVCFVFLYGRNIKKIRWKSLLLLPVFLFDSSNRGLEEKDGKMG